MLKFPLRPTVAAASAVALVALLAGCTSTGSAPAASGSGSSSKTIKTATFVNPLPDYPAWKTIGQCMAAEAKKKGITFTQSGQSGSAVDSTYMVNRIQQAIATKVDAIITFPLTASTFDPLFTQAKNAGITTVSVESGSPTTNDINVGTSQAAYGALAAQTIAKKGGHQYVGLISASEANNSFVNGFKAWLKANPSAPITLVDSRYDGADPTKTTGFAQAMLIAHPNIKMFVTDEGAATSPIVAVLKAKGLKGKAYLTTNSIYSGSVQGMKDGYVYSFLLQNMCGIGTEAIDSLVKYKAGTLKSNNIATKILFATKDDYQELTADGKFQ